MAIGFMPTDEDTEARYERLNRILLELYELVQLINREGPRTPGPPESRSPPNQPRVRPLSDSAAPRLPDLVSGSMCPPRRRISSQRSAPSSPSCSAQHHSRTFSDLFHPGQGGEVSAVPQSPLDDEVFFSAPAVRLAQPRQRRRRKRSSSFKDVKKRTKAQTEGSNESWEDEQTRIENTDRGTSANILEQDTVDSSASSGAEKLAEVSESSFVRLGRSLWTAVFLVIGWKLLVNKR